jgi:hypothetical protein
VAFPSNPTPSPHTPEGTSLLRPTIPNQRLHRLATSKSPPECTPDKEGTRSTLTVGENCRWGPATRKAAACYSVHQPWGLPGQPRVSPGRRWHHCQGNPPQPQPPPPLHHPPLAHLAACGRETMRVTASCSKHGGCGTVGAAARPPPQTYTHNTQHHHQTLTSLHDHVLHSLDEALSRLDHLSQPLLQLLAGLLGKVGEVGPLPQCRREGRRGGSGST